jgi:hypothetical protein
MARQLRFEYPGAVYHIMARGDGRKCIFQGKEDHLSFLHWQENVCGSHPDKVRCAALVRLRTAMENEWIAARLAMGGSTYVSSLIHRLLRDAKERQTMAAHARALDAESEKVGK